MFSVPRNPQDLIGYQAILEGGLRAHISGAFDLASGVENVPESWVLEMCIELPERGFYYDPLIGVSLTGKRLYPSSEIGRSVTLIDRL